MKLQYSHLRDVKVDGIADLYVIIGTSFSVTNRTNLPEVHACVNTRIRLHMQYCYCIVVA